jgi:hypothetical protein
LDPKPVRSALEQLDQIALLWREGRLHLFFLSLKRGELRELSHPLARFFSRLANWVGLRTDTTIFREASGATLLCLNPLVNQLSPREEQWEMENLEELSQEQLAYYQQLIALPLTLLCTPPKLHPFPSLPLSPRMEVVITELLLDVQQQLSALTRNG